MHIDKSQGRLARQRPAALALLGLLLLAPCGAALSLPLGVATGLTPMGSEVAGNAAGTIPAWTGGITTPPATYQKGQMHPDPFAADKEQFSITAKNLTQYDSQLTGVDRYLLTTYPETYRLPVYQTRRSCSLPNFAYDALRRNAKQAKLANHGNGIENAVIASPFPIPRSGVEVYWNHNLHYKGFKLTQKITGGTVNSGGGYTHVVREDRKLGYYYDPTLSDYNKISNKEMSWLAVWSSPSKLSGAGFSMVNFIDQQVDPRSGFMFRPDVRKIRQAPPAAVTFDAPLSSGEGTRFSDDMFLGNGSPERYDWTLLGKREIYIPYNAYKASQTSLKLEDLLHPTHLNPELLRYELHRVWVVEAKLKSDTNHHYHRRVTYYDEDSWIAVAAELYDVDDKFVAGQLGFIKNYYEVPACMQEFDVKYVFDTQRYNIDNVKIEFGPAVMDAELAEGDFGSAALRRAIAR
jgi:hypothetical protein